MASLLRDLIRFLALSSVQLAVVAAVALLALRAMRASGDATRRTLALVAVLPFLSLLAGLSPERPVRVVPAPVGVALGMEPRARTPRAGAKRAPDMLPLAGARPLAPRRAAETAVAPRADPAPRRVDRVAMVGVGWLIVMAVLLARVRRRWSALRAVLRSATPATDPGVMAAVEECCRQVGLVTPPRVLLSGACRIPFVTGVRRPCVVLPRGLLGEELRFALLHELAHLRYRDPLWVVPELALRTVYFFHPLVHGVLNRLHDERELRCDRLVTRLTGRRAAYAAFLLDEVRLLRERPWQVPALALRGGPKAVALRVRRILEGGKAMRNHLRERLTVGSVAALLVFVLSCGTTSVATGEENAVPVPASPDHINASKTETPGLYQVLPAFERLTEVYVIKKAGPYGQEHRMPLAAGEGYTFDSATGKLTVKPPIDDDKQMVVVHGLRTMPWTWQAGEPLAPGSVRVLLGEREGQRGVDFEVDEASGRFWLLKPELCDNAKPYFISYGFPVDPRKPDVSRGGSIGNHRDRAAIQRFLGLPETPLSAEEAARSIGTSASPTEDPRRWTIVQPMESLRVAVAKKGEPGRLRWLDRSEDFVYDDLLATIVFLGDIRLDEGEFLFVQGVPRDRGVFFAHRALAQGEVSVTVDGRGLVEGTGFRVDYAAGKITVLDEAIRRTDAKFRVSAGNWTYGN